MTKIKVHRIGNEWEAAAYGSIRSKSAECTGNSEEDELKGEEEEEIR